VRRLTGILFAFTLGWAALTGVSAANADTTVSLTFDDGNADQMPAVQMLTDHGMHGTFYIIPGRVDRPNSQYMTWANVQTIFAAGNEIGGHTQNHLHLPDLSASQQQSEICGGRDSLLAKGYPQISFAYPFGDHDSTSEALVQQCGYLSGRGVGGLRDTGEPDADTIPPRNPWLLPTPGSIDIDDTLPDIKQWIMDAEAAGAGGHSWINLVIHHLCDPHVTDCSDSDGVDDAYITPQDFDALLDWLQPRELTGTHVKRVEDVMTGGTSQDTTPPTSSIQCNGATCSSGFYNPSVSVKLFGTDTGGSGLKSIHYTTDGSTPDASDPSVANGGSVPISSTTTIKFRAEDNAGNLETATNSKTIQIDSAKPTSSIQCNGSACSSSFYNTSVSATLSGSDTGGSGLKGIHYTTDGSTPDASDPSVANGGSVAINSTTTLKFRAEDNAGNLESSTHTQAISIDTAKPTSSIQCNGSSCASGFYNATVSATLSGSDTGGSGFKNIRYTTDGSAPTGSSPVYTAAIPVTSTTTIRWRAEDNAGNVESNQSQTITIDKPAPTSSIQCNGAACSSGFYNGSVTATLSGSDTGGSGLKNIRYTTNGADPTGSSTVYSGPISVPGSTTIKWRAEDNAGNVESPVHSQLISIDNAKPTSSILCDGAPCEASYDHSVEATLSATDTGGSGLKNIRYTTDGSIPTSSSSVFSGAIPVSSTTTIKWRAEDNAGNVESPVHTQTITISIDAAQPTSAILCDGAPCQASYDHPVEATLSATDSGGSGVKEIRYTTDGSDPTSSSLLYTAPIPVDSTTTIRWRAQDNAGNVESPAHSQTIEITSAPSGGGGGGPGSVGGTLGAFASSVSLPNGTVKLTVDVTGPGELDVSDASVAGTSAVAAKKRSSRIKPTSKSVAQAAEVTLTIRASKAGKKILKRKGKLKVPVRVTFSPITGSATDLQLKLKFRINLNP
jgi:peptidoglycan/xylan/chitin deacetylase (PgdA/CDA1 family)